MAVSSARSRPPSPRPTKQAKRNEGATPLSFCLERYGRKNFRPLGEQKGVSGGNWFHPEEPDAKRYAFPAGNARLVTPLSFCLDKVCKKKTSSPRRAEGGSGGNWFLHPGTFAPVKGAKVFATLTAALARQGLRGVRSHSRRAFAPSNSPARLCAKGPVPLRPVGEGRGSGVFPFHFARNSGTIRRVTNEEVSL